MGYPAPQIIYVQSIAYPPQQAPAQVGHASWETDNAEKGFGEMPDMPGGWYQPPTSEELADINRVGPAVPLGAGAGGTYLPTFVAGMPSGDPLVSHDFGSWLSKTFRAVARSWKGLLVVNTVGLAMTFAAMWAIASAARGSVSFGEGESTTVASLIVSAMVSLFGVGMAAMVGMSFTQAAAAYVLVADAEENKGRLRLGRALSFGFRSAPRVLWGSFATMVLTFLAMVVGVAVVLIVVAPAAASAGPLRPLVSLASLAIVLGPAIYLFVTMQTSMVGVASFETGSIVGRCKSRIRGHWWSMFVRGLLVGALLFAISAAMSSVVHMSDWVNSSSSRSVGPPASPAGLAATFAFYVAAFCIQAPAQLVSYAELRSHVDGPVITSYLAEEAQ
jgi:hypothetical protein